MQDYAQVEHVQVRKLEAWEPCLPGGSRSSSVPHPFRVTLLHNSEGRQESLLLSSDSAYVQEGVQEGGEGAPWGQDFRHPCP